jgi:hypothetical protein
MSDRTTLRVSDRWALLSSAAESSAMQNVTWVAHSFAAVATHGSWALLTYGGATAAVNVSLSTDGSGGACCSSAFPCVFEAIDVRLQPPQDASDYLTRLQVG